MPIKLKILIIFLKKYLKKFTTKDILLHETDVGVNLFYLSPQQPLSINASIFINTDVEVTIYQKQQVMPTSSYQHIIFNNKIALISQVTNLMALAKNEEESETKKNEKFLLNVNRLLNEFFLFTENDQNRSFIPFEIKQFQLIFTSKKQRRYSSELLMMSYVIFATSAKAYERLLEEKVIMLPSIKTLKKIIINLDKRTGLDDERYLQMRYN